MKKMTYTQLLNQTLELYSEGKFEKAYNHLTEHADKVSGNNAQIYNFRYCIACKAGFIPLAMDLLKEAVIDKGYWYSYEYLMEDDDLAPLRDQEQFDEIAKICKIREIESKKNSEALLKIYGTERIDANQSKSLIIALHGNEENISITKSYWESCTYDGNILALPQSSQIEFSDGYSWCDVNQGTEELENHYQKVIKDYQKNHQNIILGGFSAGARVALNTILKGFIKVKGFIFVGPWLPEIEEWEISLNVMKDMGIKGYIICGEEDEDCLENTIKFAEMLDKRNIPYIFNKVPGLSHDYPVNFEEQIDEALKFVLR